MIKILRRLAKVSFYLLKDSFLDVILLYRRTLIKLVCALNMKEKPSGREASGQISANMDTYEKLIADPRWREQNAGKWVGIINGNLVGVSNSKQELIDRLDHEFPSTMQLVTQVYLNPEDEPILDMPGFDFVKT